MKQRPREATRRQRTATHAAYVLPPQRPERLREAGSKSRRKGDRSQPRTIPRTFDLGLRLLLFFAVSKHKGFYRTCLVTRASSTGRRNTIQCIDSRMLSRENHLFGSTRSKPSQGSVPVGPVLASDSSFCFQCQVGSS